MLRKMTRYEPQEMEPKELIELYGTSVFVLVKEDALNDLDEDDRPANSFIAYVEGVDAEDIPQFLALSLAIGKKTIIVYLDEIEFLSIIVLPKRK